jgi:hypothetical protein
MGNTSVMLITFLCKTLPNAKHLQKLGTFEIGTIRKKRKFCVQCFESKIELAKGGGGKKIIFTMIQFLLLPFLKKLTIFPIFLLPIHIQSSTQPLQRISALHHGL